MKDRATQSPMRKFKAIEPTININRFKRYFGGFHFNQFGTLLGVPVSFVTNFGIRTTLVIWTEAKRVIYSKSTRVICRAHSSPRQNLTNSAGKLVNSAVHRGKADEI